MERRFPLEPRRQREDVSVALQKFAERSASHRIATDVFNDVVTMDSVVCAERGGIGVVGQFKGNEDQSQKDRTPLYIVIQDGGSDRATLGVYSEKDYAMQMYGEALGFVIEERGGRVEGKLQMEGINLDLSSEDAGALEAAIAIRDALRLATDR